MREPTFAGQFYQKTEAGLRKELEEAFTGERGPGSLPPQKVDRKVVAAVVPHAGYQFSGACAAWAYHAIAASPKPDLFIILGPSHAGAKTCSSLETWKTPLGLVRTDQAFVKGLVAKGAVVIDEQAHAKEHAIEVQLPMLQFILAEPEKLKIVPILLGQDVDLAQLALDLKEQILEHGGKVTIIASSDFTHHGPQYHYVRFNADRAKNIYEFDAKMIDMIKAKKGDEFLGFVEKENATVCGADAIALLLKLIRPDSVKLEQYYTSGDVLNDYRNSVSYAAIVFEGK